MKSTYGPWRIIYSKKYPGDMFIQCTETGTFIAKFYKGQEHALKSVMKAMVEQNMLYPDDDGTRSIGSMMAEMEVTGEGPDWVRDMMP